VEERRSRQRLRELTYLHPRKLKAILQTQGSDVR
jgi:hypothetical protein